MEEYERAIETAKILKDKELRKDILISLNDIERVRLIKFESVRRG